MQITFDTTTITDDEVRGIFALLDTVRPEALAVDSAPPLREEDGIVTNHPLVPPAIQETVLRQVATHDSNGLPWDERIHASSKALNADGTWRTKRGVDKALVAQVEAELRSRTTATREITETGVDEEGFVTIEPVGEPVITVAPPAPPAPVAPLAPAPSPEPAESVPTPPAGVSPFVALMKRVTTAQGAGKLTQPRVKELLESLDKKSIMDLRTDEDALASFAVLLDGEGV